MTRLSTTLFALAVVAMILVAWDGSPEVDALDLRSVPTVQEEPTVAVSPPLPDTPRTPTKPASVGESPERSPGRIVIEATDSRGRGVAGIQLEVQGAMEGQRPRTAVTDELGRAIFDDLPIGEYSIVAGDEFGARCEANPCSEPGFGVGGYFVEAPRTQEATLTEDSETGRASFTVIEAAQVHGTVQGPSGETSRCQVLFHSMVDRRAWYSMTDPATGEFCTSVPPGRYLVRAGLFAGGRMTWPTPELIELQPGESKSMSFTFGLGHATVRGTVVDQVGAPWEGLEAKVFARLPWENQTIGSQYSTHSFTALTAKDGTFSAGPLPSGLYGLSFRVARQGNVGPGCFGEYPETIEFEVRDDTATVDLGTSLAYRWTPLRVQGQISMREAIPVNLIRAFVDLPSLQGDEKRRRRRLQLADDGSFQIEVSSHKEDFVQVIIEGDLGERTYRREIIAGSREDLSFRISEP